MDGHSRAVLQRQWFSFVFITPKQPDIPPRGKVEEEQVQKRSRDKLVWMGEGV
ncbi:hypothetical protein BDZ91DRAFT_741161 [Kalaharituber pfeilii]|nr:hypothetical protein BDZ91DRAFT_741161 [Kalaharituber pfeilii]